MIPFLIDISGHNFYSKKQTERKEVEVNPNYCVGSIQNSPVEVSSLPVDYLVN